MDRLLLVHPPLLGPAVLGPLAARLRAGGATVAVPDLRAHVPDPAAGRPSAAGWAQRWAAVVGPADVVVGFSGAGIALPLLAEASGARRAVWLDAVLPPAAGTARWPAGVRERVAPLVGDDGRVADWTTWWGPDAMAGLVPDAGVRAAVLAEGHRLPADLWSTGVPVPPLAAEARYVHLSPAYDGDAAAARDRGWPVAGDGRGAHLAVATDPARVAALLR
ncbi:alpha/beta hydrolase [Geodermatophilus tzadiensis]|uniref:alpha/beta hydrolase n=1 Tax=Geodermatophilus tzadiensis TaxID=1137988 RepID=UPI0011B1E24B|nr:alpha/beta hydrolase [Geodermatophilus tzadiensis]